MNLRSTALLLLIAAGLLALIFFVEQSIRRAQEIVPTRKVLPDFKAAAVTSLQIVPNAQVEIRADKTNASWQLTRPLSYAAETSAVESFLRALETLEWQGHLTARELQDRPDAQEEFG